jgi:hypothetical protein
MGTPVKAGKPVAAKVKGSKKPLREGKKMAVTSAKKPAAKTTVKKVVKKATAKKPAAKKPAK